MLFKACIILTAIAVCICEDTENCPARARQECNSDDLPADYPETIEELKRDCNTIQEVGRCHLKVFKDCPGFEEHALSLETFLKFLEDACHEDSHLFQEVSTNIECITPAIRSLPEECTWESFSKEEMLELISLLQPLWEKGSYLCGIGVEKITCAAHVISRRCGSHLKDVVTTIFEHTDGNYDECTEELLEELAPFKAYYEELLDKQDMLKYILSEEE